MFHLEKYLFSVLFSVFFFCHMVNVLIYLLLELAYKELDLVERG